MVPCGKDCGSTSKLMGHLRVHFGDKPYSCDTCGKALADSSALTVHLRVHSGDKPHSCDTTRATHAARPFPIHLVSNRYGIKSIHPALLARLAGGRLRDGGVGDSSDRRVLKCFGITLLFCGRCQRTYVFSLFRNACRHDENASRGWVTPQRPADSTSRNGPQHPDDDAIIRH